MKNNQKPQKQILMDIDGYNQYLEKIQNLRNVLNNVCKETVDERSFGGTDGAIGEGILIKAQEIDRIKNELSALLNELQYITIIQKHNKDNTIDVNDTVLVRLPNGNNVDEFIIRLVGGLPDNDAEILQVSLNSPVGKAIYDKEIGSTNEYSVGNKNYTVTILEKLNKKLSK